MVLFNFTAQKKKSSFSKACVINESQSRVLLWLFLIPYGCYTRPVPHYEGLSCRHSMSSVSHSYEQSRAEGNIKNALLLLT